MIPHAEAMMRGVERWLLRSKHHLSEVVDLLDSHSKASPFEVEVQQSMLGFAHSAGKAEHSAKGSDCSSDAGMECHRNSEVRNLADACLLQKPPALYLSISAIARVMCQTALQLRGFIMWGGSIGQET